MNEKERAAFSLGYRAGLRAMLQSINEGGAGDFRRGDDPMKITRKGTMSQRLIDKILESTNL